MTKTASFSNGHTRTYKGKRDVGAAWILMDRETRETITSGFSLDLQKARKTAESKVRECRGGRVYFAGADRAHWNRMMMNRDTRQRVLQALADAGYVVKNSEPSNLRRLVQDANAKKLDQARATVSIEIIDV